MIIDPQPCCTPWECDMSDQVGMEGAAPQIMVGRGNPQSAVYGRMWAQPAYRVVSPGEQLVPSFMRIANPPRGASIVDLGCGTGRAGAVLASAGFHVALLDFAGNCLDDSVRALGLPFVKADLELPLPVTAAYGLCCDVMEHIPPDQVPAVLTNILNAAHYVFFSIATREDACGSLINERLHLTVQPFGWWMRMFARMNCQILWCQESPGDALFYVSNWTT